ncbi:hypothetical protein [Deinococcus apachensis]|uniref:hypothetical protein n=1 Tax=Deinococcus apachensis TaxID=309886 RepID=UPI0003747336|nr:hypothetical protein [Deinococcus apachensis]
MAAPKRDNARAARALVDAALLGDATACTKHEITLRTLQRYRAALDDDEELSSFYSQLSRAVTTQNWAQELNITLVTLVRRQEEIARDLRNPTAENLSAITGAIKALAEIAITREVLGAGDGQPDSGDPETGRQDSTA